MFNRSNKIYKIIFGFHFILKVQMVSFQCSPLSTPDGILGTFRQCAEFQKAKDLEKFVSVVVLDEIGLAEDSPKMPLKVHFCISFDSSKLFQSLEDLELERVYSNLYIQTSFLPTLSTKKGCQNINDIRKNIISSFI